MNLSSIIMRLEQIARDAETREGKSRAAEIDRAARLEAIAEELYRLAGRLKHGR